LQGERLSFPDTTSRHRPARITMQSAPPNRGYGQRHIHAVIKSHGSRSLRIGRIPTFTL